jgi:hypothetical protein
MGPPRYGTTAIKPVRPPQVEGELGRWRAWWQLTLARPLSPRRLQAAEGEVSASTGIEIHLALLSGCRVRLETTTAVHPLDVEAWPTVDSILLALDRLLSLVEINDCPRGWWRPFR